MVTGRESGVGREGRGLFSCEVLPTSSSPFRSCDPPPFGAYPEEGKEAATSSWPVTEWETNAKNIDVTLSDMWQDETMQKIIEEEGGWARVIAYHDINFEENNLINYEDKKKAKELKENVKKVRGILFSMLYHTFVSPPNWTIIAEAIGGVMLILWIVVYVGGIASYLVGANIKNNSNEVSMDFAFEISEVEDGERGNRGGEGGEKEKEGKKVL